MFRPSFKNLMNDVVAYGSCTECLACVVACPYHVIENVNGMPMQTARPELAQDHCIVSENIGCDVCAQVCPRLPPNYGMLDEHVFGRAKTPEENSFGIHEELFVARTTDEAIRLVGQDGGVVTTVLAWGLEQGIFDGAVACGPSDVPCAPEPKIVTTREELLKTAGSWYTYCPNPYALLDIEKTDYKRLAFVGTSCQVTPVVKSQVQSAEVLRFGKKNEKQWAFQAKKLKSLGERVTLTVGLLCCEVFSYDGLMVQMIQGELGIPLDTIQKFNVKGKVLVYPKGKEVVEIPLKEAQAHQRAECQYCADFAAEHADISAGGVGTIGWTIIIVRSKKGKVVMDAVRAAGLLEVKGIEEFPTSLKVLHRLARKSRERVPLYGVNGQVLSYSQPD